jgi:hypothetical protein
MKTMRAKIPNLRETEKGGTENGESEKTKTEQGERILVPFCFLLNAFINPPAQA